MPLLRRVAIVTAPLQLAPSIALHYLDRDTIYYGSVVKLMEIATVSFTISKHLGRVWRE